MKKIKFQHENFDGLKKKIKNKEFGNKVIFNFLNSHDIYNLKKNKEFRKSLEHPANVNFIDGFINAAIMSIKNLKKVNRMRGPSFTHQFLDSKEAENKKHLFVGQNKEEVLKIADKYGLNKKKVFAYNPPFIKTLRFPEKEVNKIAKKINKISPDYLWIGIGCPKQNILAIDLFDKINVKYIFNVGAGLDFVLEKKVEAPKWIQGLGVEWSYRLITDFKYSWKKVLRSLVGSWYALNIVDLENRNRKKNK